MKILIFICLIIISTSSFSGKLDDIQDSLDEIQNRQRINENYLITNCPKFDSVINISDYVKNMGKSK
jgi:hypothetical protein